MNKSKTNVTVYYYFVKLVFNRFIDLVEFLASLALNVIGTMFRHIMGKYMNKFIGIFCMLSSVYLIGCKTTGYLVTVSTPQLTYLEIEKIENNLNSKGFEIGIKERKTLQGRVQTDLNKKLTDEPYWFVESYIKYKKNDQDKIAREVELEFSNIYIGLITPEIKNQIESLGNEFQKFFSDFVGKENVNIQSKEWGPPKFY